MSIEIGKTEKNLNVSLKFWFKPIFFYIYSLILVLYFLGWYNLLKEASFVFMRLSLFENGTKAIFPQLFMNLLNSINVKLT